MRSLTLLIPIFVAPLVGCAAGPSKDDTDVDADTDVSADTDDAVDTDVAADTDADDTDDTDVPATCGDGMLNADLVCFGAPTPTASGEGDVTALALADWDGEGVDVVLARGASLYLKQGDGAGGLGSETTIAGTLLGSPITQIVSGHVDAGVETDLVVGGVGTYGRILFGDGQGSSIYEDSPSGEGSVLDIHVADIAGSGPSDDVITADTDCGVWMVTTGSADGNFRYDQDYVCDVDLVAITQTSSTHSSAVQVQGTSFESGPFLEDLAGYTADITVTLTLPAEAVNLVSGDLDGDGNDEVVVLLDDGTLRILFSDGADDWVAQGVGSWTTYNVTGSPTDLALGDLDGDADLDIAVASTDDDAVILLVNDGSGTFAPQTLALAADAAPVFIALGDLNEDGADDIVVTSAASITVLLSNP